MVIQFVRLAGHSTESMAFRLLVNADPALPNSHVRHLARSYSTCSARYGASIIDNLSRSIGILNTPFEDVCELVANSSSVQIPFEKRSSCITTLGEANTWHGKTVRERLMLVALTALLVSTNTCKISKRLCEKNSVSAANKLVMEVLIPQIESISQEVAGVELVRLYGTVLHLNIICLLPRFVRHIELQIANLVSGDVVTMLWDTLELSKAPASTTALTILNPSVPSQANLLTSVQYAHLIQTFFHTAAENCGELSPSLLTRLLWCCVRLQHETNIKYDPRVIGLRDTAERILRVTFTRFSGFIQRHALSLEDLCGLLNVLSRFPGKSLAEVGESALGLVKAYCSSISKDNVAHDTKLHGIFLSDLAALCSSIAKAFVSLHRMDVSAEEAGTVFTTFSRIFMKCINSESKCISTVLSQKQVISVITCAPSQSKYWCDDFKSGLVKALQIQIDGELPARDVVQSLYAVSKLPRGSILCSNDLVDGLLARAFIVSKALEPLSLAILFKALTGLSQEFYMIPLLQQLRRVMESKSLHVFRPRELVMIFDALCTLHGVFHKIQNGNASGTGPSLSREANLAVSKPAGQPLTPQRNILRYISSHISSYEVGHVAIVMLAAGKLFGPVDHDVHQFYTIVGDYLSKMWLQKASSPRRLPPAPTDKEVAVILTSFARAKIFHLPALQVLSDFVAHSRHMEEFEAATIVYSLGRLNYKNIPLIQCVTQTFERLSVTGLHTAHVRAALYGYAALEIQPPECLLRFIQENADSLDKISKSQIRRSLGMLGIENVIECFSENRIRNRTCSRNSSLKVGASPLDLADILGDARPVSTTP